MLVSKLHKFSLMLDGSNQNIADFIVGGFQYSKPGF